MAITVNTPITKGNISITIVGNPTYASNFSQSPSTGTPANFCVFNPLIKFTVGGNVSLYDVEFFVSLEDDIGVEENEFYGDPISIGRGFTADSSFFGFKTQINDFYVRNTSNSTITYYVFAAINCSAGMEYINIGTITFIPLVSAGYEVDHSNAQKEFYLGEPINTNNVLLYDTFRYDALFTTSTAIVERKSLTPTFTLPQVSTSGTYSVSVNYNGSTITTYSITVLSERYTDYVVEETYKIALNVSTITHGNDIFYFGERWEDEKLVGKAFPLYKEVNENGNYTGDNVNDDCVGYIDFGVDKKAHVVLFEDPDNPLNYQDLKHASENITVVFPNYDEKATERVNKCQFGIVYNNRLFVSGNPDFKNCDWHTQPINDADYDTTHDYTYFSDLDYCYYGGDDTAVVGYDIFRDGDLIVVKEGSRNQATLYRRTHELVNAMSYDGNSTVLSGLVEDSFPMFDINSNGGEGGLSFRSIANFVGETLVLTKTGLKALTTNEDIKNNAKYAVEYSTNIDPKITKEDIKNAFLFTYKETLLLTTSRGTYVRYYGLKDEWYFLNGFTADYFFEYDDELYFANNNGNIYRFPVEDLESETERVRAIKYLDRDRVYIASGGVAVNTSGNEDGVITISSNYKDYVKNDLEFVLQPDSVWVKVGYCKYAGEQPEPEDTIGFSINRYEMYVTDDFAKWLLTRSTKAKIGTSSIEYDFQYNEITRAYSFYYNNQITNLLSGVNIYVKLSEDVPAIIKNVTELNGGGKDFELYVNDKKVVVTSFVQGATSGIITKPTPVSAYYVTIPYSFGTMSRMKNIWSWTVANDTDLASYMDVGYLTSVNQGGFKADWAVQTTSGSRSWDFIWNPSQVQFTSDLLPHIYVRYRTIPMVNFLRFMFKNDTSTNMVLSLLEVTYSIGEFSRGTK